MLGCAVCAFFMALGGLPMTPMMLAFILGDQLEQNLRRSLQMAQGNPFVFFTRPISCVFLLIALLAVIVPFIKPLFPKKAENKGGN